MDSKDKLKDWLVKNNIEFDIMNKGYHWSIKLPCRSVDVWFNKYERIKMRLFDKRIYETYNVNDLIKKLKQESYSPFKPSKSAINKVKDVVDLPRKCNCCGNISVSIAQNNIVYGKNYGKYPWIYYCNHCEAYVGMHPNTNIPLGTLADKETRNARKLSKKPFEYLYKNKHISRNDAYQKLSQYTGIAESYCHFGMFGVMECRYAWMAIKRIYKDLNLDFDKIIKEVGCG